MEYVWNEWQGEKEAAYGEQRNQCQGFYRPGACLGGRADACGHVRAPDRAYQRSDVSFLLQP